MSSRLPTLPPDPRERFFDLMAEGRWHKLVLAGPRAAALAPETDLQRVVVRPLELRGQACLQFVDSHRSRDITVNLPVAQGLDRLRTLIGTVFRNAHLFSPGEETQLRFSKRGKAHLSLNKLEGVAQEVVPAGGHDRPKQRWLEQDRPFLLALGITHAQHQIVPAMARKWRQINKFIEVFAHALASSRLADARALRVVDFGAGKAYLSFALHDWLRHTKGVQADVTGVELRADLVAQGQRVIADLGLQGMHIEQGDVRSQSVEPMNVMIALHACDTATDHAIHLGLRAGADIIMCSPCCHKQLRPQLLSPHALRSVFQHGIHAEQQAEMVTDSLRALLLQSQGYDTQVFEFVSLEHTAKNKMILAVRRQHAAAAGSAAQASLLRQVAELKEFFGVREQALERLLLDDALAVAGQPGQPPAPAG